MTATVVAHELAARYHRLPWEIKQLPLSEVVEMIEINNLKANLK